MLVGKHSHPFICLYIYIFIWTPPPSYFSTYYLYVQQKKESDETGRPNRFELRSHARSSCCCTEGREWWRCFQNQCKQTPKNSILREKRMHSYHCYLRTDLCSHVLYTEYNFYSFFPECDVKSTVRFLPCVQVLWVEHVHSRSVNHGIISPVIMSEKNLKHVSIHKILKQIDVW